MMCFTPDKMSKKKILKENKNKVEQIGQKDKTTGKKGKNVN